MKKAIRLALGAMLPVLLYCTGAAILTLKRFLTQDPIVMGQAALLWLGYGFMIMGIPSIIYSVIIEYLRTKKRKNLMTCSSVGAFLGFALGSLCLFLDFKLVALLTLSLPGALIGAIIPVLLWPIETKTEPNGSGNAIRRAPRDAQENK